MRKHPYFTRLKTLLFEKGISEGQSDHLVEELQDHLVLQVVAFQARGNNPEDSERFALEQMGTPEEIAKKAGADLQGGWLMRWAWLLCGGGFFAAVWLTLFAIMFLGYYFAGGLDYDNGSSTHVSLPVLQIEVVLFNWLPLLMGMAGLTLLIRFSSIGWISIYFIAIALGIAVSAEEMRFAISPIADSAKLCFLEVDDSLLAQGLRLGGGRSLEHEPVLLTLFRLLVPLGMCFFARYVQPHAEASRSASGKLLKVS